MNLKPFLTYKENTSRLEIENQFVGQSLLFKNAQKINLFIGFVQTKKEQIQSMFEINYQKTSKNVLIWVSEQFQIGIQNTAVRILYLQNPSCNSFLKHEDKDKFQQLSARLVISMSQFLIYDVNSKYMKAFNNESPKVVNQIKSFLMLSHSIGQVYMVDTLSNINKIQLSNKVTKDRFISEIENKAKEFLAAAKQEQKQLFAIMNISRFGKMIQKCFKNFISLKNQTNCQMIWLYFILNRKMHEFFEIYLKQYQKLRYQNKYLSVNEISNLQEQVSKLIESIRSEKTSQVCDFLKEEFITQIRRLNQSHRNHFIQKAKQISFDNLESYFDVYKMKEKIAKDFRQHNIDQFWLNCISSQAQKRITVKQSSKINQALIQRNSEKSMLEFQLKQKEKTILQYERQIEELNESLYSFQNINQQFRLCHDDMQREKGKNKVLQLEVKSLQVQLNKKAQSQKYLEKFIGRLMQQKAEYSQQVELLKINIQNLQSINQRYFEEIQLFNKKITQLNKLQDWAKQSIEDSKLMENQLQHFKNWIQNIEINIKAFKQSQANKINYMLRKNHEKHCEVIKKNECLKQYINKLQEEKQKMLQKIETQRNKSLYFEKQVMWMLNASKDRVIKEECAELQVTDRDLACAINKINRNFQTQIAIDQY